MEKQLTLREAWADFYVWARAQPFWKDIKGTDLRRLYDAKADYNGSRGQGLGPEGIKSRLRKYAPERDEYRETVIIDEN